jgi:hypothetical protein
VTTNVQKARGAPSGNPSVKEKFLEVVARFSRVEI